MVAAVFAVLSVVFWTQRRVEEQNLTALREQLKHSERKSEILVTLAERWKNQITDLQNKDRVSQLKIVLLQPDNGSKSHGTFIWDGVEKKGLLIAEGVPQPPSGRDYQLWFADEDQPAFDGGVLTVEKNGSARLHFSPKVSFSAFDKILVTLAPKGGEQTPSGKVVLSGKSK